MKKITAILLILLPLSQHFSQDTVYVPGDHATIQAAINASNNGDVVLVAENTYYENINFMGKAITVASYFLRDGNESHIENTIINGSLPSNPDSGSVVNFTNGEDTTSVLCGFSITGGSGTYISGSDYRVGAGIMLFLSGAKICHNIITSNSIDNSTTYTRCYGGGIMAYSQPSNLVISNNVISNNSILNSAAVGGGISAYSTGPAWIVNNKILNNVINCSNGSGGGIDIWGPYDEIYVNNNIIRGNQVLTNDYGGGGIDVFELTSAVYIRNNLIAENIGFRGGGILVEDITENESAKMKNLFLKNHNSGEINIFDNPKSSSNKYLFEATIENNTIVENNAVTSHGGIYCTNSSPSVINSIVWGNTSPGGLQIGGTPIVEYSDVEGGYTGTGNINEDPRFAPVSDYYQLSGSSPCIDAGNPDPTYFDMGAGGNPMWPAQGSLVNDMGHCGGPNSLWCFLDWPLPVELTSFTAIVQNENVLLNWTTATETNNFGFEIERKIMNAGKEWITIGFREGKGSTSETHNYQYIDNISDLQALSISYRLKQIDFDGSYEYSEKVLVENPAPVDYALQQNYPNPFNPATTISYSLALKSQVELVLFNALGERVTQLVNEEKEAGKYSIEFNSAGLPSGLYLYRLQAGDFVQVRKMMLLK